MGRQIEMPEFKHGRITYWVKYPWSEMEVGDYFITVDRSARQIKRLIRDRWETRLDRNRYTVEALAASTKVTRVE